jgi:LacI family gluconate utilization system Gnt-I transcriptional repressor
MNDKKNVTISDVAREAGVSAMTVSRALREPGKVNPARLEHILGVVRRLGYTPNHAAQALAAGTTRMLAVLIPSVTNNVFVEVLEGIYEVAEERNWQVQIGNTKYSPLVEQDLVRSFLNQNIGGLILAGVEQTDMTRKLLRDAKVRIAQIMDNNPNPIDMNVGFSHENGAERATQHLMEMGYKKPAFLAAQLDPRTLKRIAGYRAALEKQNSEMSPIIVSTPEPSSVGLGCALMADLLAKHPQVDSVVCNNDDIAVGALFECQRRGIHVPKELGICGFNDLGLAAHTAPSITSIRTDRHKIGHLAAQMVLDAATSNEPEVASIDIGFDLIARQSTARV